MKQITFGKELDLMLGCQSHFNNIVRNPNQAKNMFLQFRNYPYRFDKKKNNIFVFLQGAIFCFVDEGQCDDQLRAKYQYPGWFFLLSCLS